MHFNSYRGCKFQIFLFLRVFKMECKYFYPNSYHLWQGAEKKNAQEEKKTERRKKKAFNDVYPTLLLLKIFVAM